ncbi:GNAT family N-acetyltransferase [Eubacteriales bacterium OttesenSCG-928-M02]|nr:GNAT family N-acetyltransferase [Eubacteriales bacterium OttesenSCG-928-M02]
MFHMRYAQKSDAPFWFSLDAHLSADGFQKKVRDNEGYIIENGGRPAGVLRHQPWWDHIPFLSFLHLQAGSRNKGLGTQAVLYWESEMRQLGYVDKGSIFFDGTPLHQPQKLIRIKAL